MLAASLLSVVAAAQQQPAGPGLNIPSNVQIVGDPNPNVRKATAIVNGEVITESDIDHRLALILASQRGMQLPPEEVQRFRAQVLRNLIDETLQIQAAQQEEITVEDREVDNYFNQFSRQFSQTPQTFATYLRSIGSSERSIKRQIRGEIAWTRLQRNRIEPFVSVSEDEVRSILNRFNTSRGTAEYRVAEIFISATPETTAEAQANAARIVQQIRQGASFPAYARQFSEASTAAVGGDLGWIRPEQLPAELSGLVTQMPVGAISDPIPLPGGFSIVALIDSRTIGVADPRNAVLSLVQMTITIPPGTPQAQAEARARQLAETTQSMGGCGGAADAAARIGAEIITNDQTRVRDLPPQLGQALLQMSIGQASPAFGAPNERYSVLILCGRDDPEPITEPSETQITESLMEQRVNQRAQRYLRDLRRDAVVDYR